MKINEIVYKGKVLEFNTELGLIHFLAEELKTDSLREIIDYFSDVDGKDGVKISSLPRLSKLVRGAILIGSKEDIPEKDLDKWVLPNMLSVRKILMAFYKNMPGNGESDQAEGNVPAL